MKVYDSPRDERFSREDEWAAYEADPLVTLEAGGECFHIRRSRMSAAAKSIAEDVRAWLDEQKNSLDEAEYLGLLCSLEKDD
jgi:hypothetical protein